MSVLVPEGPDAGQLWHRGDPFAEQKRFEAGDALVNLGNREVVKVAGPDRTSWLHSLTTGDFEHAQTGQRIDALVLSPNGHIQHQVQAVDDGDALWLISETGSQGTLGAFLESMRFRMKVEIEDVDDAHVIFVGSTLDQNQTGLDGYQPIAPVFSAEFGAGSIQIVGAPLAEDAQLNDSGPVSTHLVGAWAWEAERIAAGVPRIGVDTDDKTLPNELGLYATVLNKGCYCGQETVARVHNLGRPPRRLVRLLLDGSQGGRLPQLGAQIVADGQPVGFIGASAQHWQDGPIGLGLIKRSVPVDAPLIVDGIDAAQDVLVDPNVGLHIKPDEALKRR